MTQPSPTPIAETAPQPPARNAAVLRCCAARDLSLADSRARGLEKYPAHKAAADAYMQAMPDLSGYENIRDFIACVAHGLVTGDISSIESSTYFYAAQVATGAFRSEPNAAKTPKEPASVRKAA